MKQTVAKIGVAIALVISIFANSIGGILAEEEKQIQEYTAENYKNEGKVEDIETKEVVEQEEQTASYILSRSKFREMHTSISYNIKSVKFTDQPLPAGAKITDLSENNDGSIVGTVVNGEFIITTNAPGVKVKFPRDSSYLFAKYYESTNLFFSIFRDSIDVSNVDTSEVENMRGMFGGIDVLTHLDLSSFDTSNVIDMYRMIFACGHLVEVDLTGFDTSNVENMKNMFQMCESLTTIKSEAWDISKVTEGTDMFLGCEKLVGISKDGIMTPYDAERVGAEMATPNGGYFSGEGGETGWLVNIEYQTEDGTVVKNELLQVTQDNPTISAQVIADKVPAGYELITIPTDWTPTANGEKNIVKVRAIEWTVELTYQTTDGVIIKNEQLQVAHSNLTISAQTIINKVPEGYELVTPATDWTPVADGERKIVEVRAIEWTVSLEYQTTDGMVVKTETMQVTQLNPVVSAQTIATKVPVGYELVTTASDWTVAANGEKKIVEVREAEWLVSIEYQIEDGAVIKTEVIQVTKLNPVVNAQTIIDNVPAGYELVTTPMDWTPVINGDKYVIKVREIEWTIMVEFVTQNSRGVVETVSFTVGNINPVIGAQQIIDAIPAGYYAVNEIQDLRATKDGEIFQIVVQKVEYREGIVHFVDQNGVTVKTQVYTVSDIDPIIRVEELEKALPAGATLVNPLTELTVTKDKEEFTIQVIMPVEQEPNQPEIGGNDDTTTDAKQPEGSIEGVQTGDTTQMGLWSAIMAGSVGVLAYLKRKKNNIRI